MIELAEIAVIHRQTEGACPTVPTVKHGHGLIVDGEVVFSSYEEFSLSRVLARAARDGWHIVDVHYSVLGQELIIVERPAPVR